MTDHLITKTFTFTNPQSDIVVDFDFHSIDSWDHEFFYVTINGYVGLRTTSTSYKVGESTCGPKADWSERIMPDRRASVKLPCASQNIKVTFIGKIDDLYHDESYGVKNVKVTGTNRCSSNCECCSLLKPSSCLKCSQPGCTVSTPLQEFHNIADPNNPQEWVN